MNKKAMGVSTLVTAIVVIALIVVIAAAFLGPLGTLFNQISEVFGLSGKCQSPAVLVKSIEDALKEGRTSDARQSFETFQTCYKQLPNVPVAILEKLAEAYASGDADGDINKMIGILRVSVERFPNDINFVKFADQFIKGHDAIEKNQNKEALIHFDALKNGPLFLVISSLPFTDLARLGEAESLLDSKKYGEAIEMLSEVKTIKTDRYFLLLGRAYAQQFVLAPRTYSRGIPSDPARDINDAIQVFSTANNSLESNYYLAEAYVQRCELLMKEQKNAPQGAIVAEGEMTYYDAIKIYQTEAKKYYSLSIIAAKKQEAETARKFLEEAQKGNANIDSRCPNLR